jgi:hypothetical protein
MLIVTDTARWGHEARAVNTCYHALIAGCVSGRIQFKEVSSLRLVLAVHESGCGVRRGKAALSSGCKSHPATAPAGSNRSSHGGDEMAEAFG